MKSWFLSLKQRFVWPLKRSTLIILLTMAAIPTGYGLYTLAHTWYEVAIELNKAPEEIVGKKVTLRLLKEEYFIDYHNMFSNAVRKNLEFPDVITLGYTIQYLRSEMKKEQEGKMVQYCVFDNISNALIGAVEIRNKNNEDPGQLGCWINEAYWGGGRFQEALDLITKIYFRLKPHEKSYIAHVRLWNQRSYHALKKFGLKDIGYFYENGKATRYILEMKRK